MTTIQPKGVISTSTSKVDDVKSTGVQGAQRSQAIPTMVANSEAKDTSSGNMFKALLGAASKL